MAMHRITTEREGRVTWEDNISDFENPETLIAYLRKAAPRAQYQIQGLTVDATDAAIDAAIQALEDDIAMQEQERRQAGF